MHECSLSLPSDLHNIWSENSSPTTEVKDGTILDVSFSPFSIVFVCAVCKMPKFRILTSIQRKILWFYELIIWLAMRSDRKKLELVAGGSGIKTVYDLQSYWTSMAAILVSLFS